MRVQPPNRTRGPVPFVAVSLLAILLTGQVGAVPLASGQTVAPTSKPQYQGYGLSAFGVNDSVSLFLLEKSTGGDLSVAGLESYIRTNLLSYDVRQVLLDIGWQNYTKGHLQNETWVNNWLTACDSLGVGNVLFVSQLTAEGIGSPWVTSLIASDPAAQTFYSDGAPAPYVSLSSPDVVTQLEHDLATLYSYYGRHTSWIGIGTGSTPQDPYYSQNSSMPTMGYSNATLAAFSRSPYFQSDINASGYDTNGVLDLLWSEFRSISPSIQLSSGDWQLSVPVSVFGTVTTGDTLAMRFYLPGKQSDISIEWYGRKVGSSPGPLLAQVVNDSSGKPSLGSAVSSANETSGSVTQTDGWQGPLEFRGNFTRGYYWLYLTSPTSGGADSYHVYVRNYPVDSLFAQNDGKDTGHRLSNIGDSILWIKGSDGADLALYPYVQPLVVPQEQQTFVAQSTFSFNTVYLFLSDRHYDPTNGTVSIVDTTLNSVVDSGVLSQSLTHGLQNWTPVALNQTMVALRGHSYMLVMSEPNGGYSWVNVLRGLSVSPAAGGFQGQTQFWLFRLAMVNWGAGHFDFTSDGPNGRDQVSPGHPDAISFTVPASQGGQTGLTGLSVFMMNPGSSKFYPANVSMTVSIHANNQTTGFPVGTSLQSTTLPGSSIPEQGWLNMTGSNLQLASGGTYWVVFSTNSKGAGFPMARLVSPYDFQTLVSLNNGTTWTNPGEGPTDLAFTASFSGGRQLGNFIQGVPAVRVDKTNFFAQPFSETNNSQVSGVFIGPVKAKTLNPNQYVVVSINPTNGTGQPSGQALAEGRLYAGNITLNYGLQYIQFSSVARLEAGHEYWIVVRGLGGNFEVDPVMYSYKQPAVAQSMVSRNGGYSWTAYANLTTTLSFRIAVPSQPLPTYSTPQLASDLAEFHDLNPSIAPTAGWSSYVKSMELERAANLTDWFRGLSGKQFNFYGTSLPSILTNLHPPHFTSVPSNGDVSTCQALSAYLLSALPSGGSQFQVVDNLKLLKSCFTPSASNLVGQLNYVRFQGPQYGLGTAASVLVLGTTPDDNLTSFLWPAYNVTYVDLQSNPLTAMASMGGGYKVIIVDASPTVNAVLSASLESFAAHGGTLLDLGRSSQWLDSLVSSCPSTVQGSLGAFQGQLDYWTRNTGYFQKLNAALANGSFVATGPGVAVQQNRCGLGEVIALDEGSGTAQVSGSATMVSNIVANTYSPNSASPFWYGPATGTSPSSLSYNIGASVRGEMLLWVSNTGTATEPLSISLNGTYYGLPSAWKVVDLSALAISTGHGSPVSIDAQVPPSSWVPLYIVPDNASVRGDYSSLAILSDYRYPNQMLVSTQGPAGQSGLLVLTSNRTVSGVSPSGQPSLGNVTSPSALLAGQPGWYFDNSTRTLMVGWVANTTSTLRIMYATVPTIPPKVFPQTVFLLLFSTLLAVELIVFAYLRTQGKAKHQGPGPPRSGARATPSRDATFGLGRRAPGWTGRWVA